MLFTLINLIYLVTVQEVDGRHFNGNLSVQEEITRIWLTGSGISMCVLVKRRGKKRKPIFMALSLLFFFFSNFFASSNCFSKLFVNSFSICQVRCDSSLALVMTLGIGASSPSFGGIPFPGESVDVPMLIHLG